MHLKLSTQQTEELLQYKETGMGYQMVDVVLKSGVTIENAVILNAEELIFADCYTELKSADDIVKLIVQV